MLNNLINKLKSVIVKDVEFNKSYWAKMALRDTAILFAYCFDNYDMIIDNDRNLDEIFFEIISKFIIKVSGILNK